MSGLKRKKISNEEAASLGVSDASGVGRQKISNEDFAAIPEGEAGAPGHDPYASGETEQRRAQSNTKRRGDLKDLGRSWANRAALGAGPQIAGAIGAALAGPLPPGNEADAYRSVRNDAAKDIALSDETTLGDIGGGLGMLSTPIPVKALPRGAPATARAWQGAKVGGGVGLIDGAVNSKGDLTKMDGANWMRVIGDAFKHGVTGAAGGGATGALMSPVQSKAAATAEEQALRAAGLSAGIKNSVRDGLGIDNMADARALGRRFLDEDLIPPVGSSEAVAKRAAKLEDKAGAGIGAEIGGAERSPSKFDYPEMADSSRKVLDDATATADQMSGQKARALADTFEAQGARTPGSFEGANRAKSDAWKSADFRADAKMSPVLYRKAVGAARDNIEEQVSRALGPESGKRLRSANEKWSVAADAQKLAKDASTRDGAKSGMGPMKDALALLSGSVAGGAAGHPIIGAGTGLAGAFALKAADKYGHSTASRFSDFLAKRAEKNSGGAVGEAAGDELAEYLGLLEENHE